jgi:hypothetical protein
VAPINGVGVNALVGIIVSKFSRRKVGCLLHSGPSYSTTLFLGTVKVALFSVLDCSTPFDDDMKGKLDKLVMTRTVVEFVCHKGTCQLLL